MSVDNELFDPEFLGRLRALFFKLRRRRQMKKKGIQQTPTAGFTREFKDHRHYTPGDDFRGIDWRLYARLEKMFIRIFEEVQEYHVYILVDTSESMIKPYPEKRVLGLRLAVALAYLGLISQHRVSVFTFSDDMRRETPPLKGQGHIHSILKQLAGTKFEGVTNLQHSLRSFRPGRDRKGVLFLISDLFGRSPELSQEALLDAAAWPVESHVIHVLHPDEMRPNLEGELQLQDVETGEVRRMWLTKREMERYAKEFDAYVEGLQRECLRRQMDYVYWKTDHSFEEMFVELLSRGSSLAGA
ncbi:MAG: DUF58 domain-containing protein [Planctomycetes bacterium]|nr:DUF58 domain-containing protein [Planctomycetota bacterium]